jgi:hypothetical protein
MSLRDETINKLSGLIDNFPQFSDEDKKAWKERINFISPEYALFLLDLFENSPEDVVWLNQNIKDKEKILEGRDETAWRDLLEKEKENLENLTKE